MKHFHLPQKVSVHVETIKAKTQTPLWFCDCFSESATKIESNTEPNVIKLALVSQMKEEFVNGRQMFAE